MKDIETFLFGDEVLMLTILMQKEIGRLKDIKGDLAEMDITCGDIDNRICRLQSIIKRFQSC